MHERNIYKTPPNFSELAKKHPFLAPFLTLNVQGVSKINFKDDAALRALTKALLLEDFQLNVEIPENVLVPTVPLRLNYVLWLEDLLSYNEEFEKKADEICGIDVGTGATAIYALLASKKNQWKMIGSDIDPESVMVAKSNVKRNGLERFIQVKHVKDNQGILEPILTDAATNQYQFTMCNPPFFASEDEADSVSKSRKERQEPSAAKTGSGGELIVGGGEVEFICRMIEDSKKYQSTVRIFTTMVGIKKDLKDLISKLKGVGVKNFVTTEFSQGKTMRWGLAWSFDSEVHLHPPAQVTHVFERLPGCLNFETYIYTHLEGLHFKSLEIVQDHSQDAEMAEECGCALANGRPLHFIATENTWTGQRRKRREMERLKKMEEAQSDKNGGPPAKMFKMSGDESAPMECASSSSNQQEENVLLDGQLQVIRDGPKAVMNMSLLGGSLGKDGLNQILTYLRNSYNRDSQNPSTELYRLLKCEGL